MTPSRIPAAPSALDSCPSSVITSAPPDAIPATARTRLESWARTNSRLPAAIAPVANPSHSRSNAGATSLSSTVADEKKGYSIGHTTVVVPAVGFIGPVVAAALLVVFLLGAGLAGPGPGVVGDPPHAFWIWSLGIAAIAGAIMSATGFCAVTAARQVFLRRHAMLMGAGCLILGYALISLMTGAWKFGWSGQPVTQPETLWNIAAMVVVGLTGALAGECPVRQMVLSGEGNGDAFVTVMGLLVGGATALGLGIASSGTGTTEAGRAVVFLGGIAALIYAAAVTSASSRVARSD